MPVEAAEDMTTASPSAELVPETTITNSSPSSSSSGQDQQQQSFADSVKNMCYFCQKCKNHSILVWKKHHKRQCPYLECACEKCDLIETRRRLDQHIKKRRLAAAVASATERSTNTATELVKRSSAEPVSELSVLPKRLATSAGVEWGNDCGQKTPPAAEYAVQSLSSRSSMTPTSIAEITAVTPSNFDCDFHVTAPTGRESTASSSSATPPPLSAANAVDCSSAASQMLRQQLKFCDGQPPPLFVSALLENLALICPPRSVGLTAGNNNVLPYFVNCFGVDDGDQSTASTTTVTSRRTSDASCAECTAVDQQQNDMHNNNLMALESCGIVECNNNVGLFNNNHNKNLIPLNNKDCYKKCMNDDNIATSTVFNNLPAAPLFTTNAAAQQPLNSVFFPPTANVNSVCIPEHSLLNEALLREWLLWHPSFYELTKELNADKAVPVEASTATIQSSTNSAVSPFLFAPLTTIPHTVTMTTTNGSGYYDPLLENLLRNPILNFSNINGGAYGSIVDVKHQHQQLLLALNASAAQKEI